MQSNAYWKRKYTSFIKNTLKKEQNYYECVAKAIEEEAQYLIEKKDKNLKDNPEDFVVFLYINHELNKLDPIGCCYPFIINEYDSYAWRILKMYREISVEEFEGSLNKYLKSMWSSIGMSHVDKDMKINAATENIVELLGELYKVKTKSEKVKKD